MKRILAFVLMTALCAVAEQEGVRSGKATAQWLVSGKPVEAGQGYQAVIRLKVDEPWHVYWLNPGEAGMTTTAKLSLPQGWESGGLRHPIPKSFKTGGLHGFGHEGTVDYPILFLVPKDFEGDAELEAKLSWLTCNNDACVPGDAELKLKIENGKPAGLLQDTAAVEQAHAKLPILAFADVKLALENGTDHWKLRLVNAHLHGLDPAKTRVFVATPDLVSASTQVKFQKVAGQDGHWEAKCPKGEYAPEQPKECILLLVQEGQPAVRVEWRAP